jgi:hypothetical protein
MQENIPLKDKLSLYEDGKHRRYTLLFSVNAEPSPLLSF